MRNRNLKNQIMIFFLIVGLTIVFCGCQRSDDSEEIASEEDMELEEVMEDVEQELSNEAEEKSEQDKGYEELERRIQASKEKSKKKKNPTKKKKSQSSSKPVASDREPQKSEASSAVAECKQAYLEIVNSLSEENSDVTFSLIFFDDDDTPELLAGVTGSYLSMYGYHDGKVVAIMDSWPYGSAGNDGYSYVERRGIVYNVNTEYSGLIAYHKVGTLNTDSYEIEYKEEDQLSVWNVGDTNGDGKLDQADAENMEEEYTGSPTYKRGSKTISERDFDDIIRSYSLKYMVGELSHDDMATKLEVK